MIENFQIFKENILVDDKSYFFENFVNNITSLISWSDVERCLNNPILYNIDMIDNQTQKNINIPKYNTEFYGLVTSHKHIIDSFNQGNTAIIHNYGLYSEKTNDFLRMFEENFDVCSRIAVYCGLKESKSFKIHADEPSNFIIQVEGESEWVIYKEKTSSLYSPSKINEIYVDDRALEIETECKLKSGDMLYIPARSFHQMKSNTKRISLSVPCFPREQYKLLPLDRNYYSIGD